MVIFKKIADIQSYIISQRAQNRNIGFVPTMGALHNGHISLVKHAKDVADIVVSSIFVNPTQFNDAKDFEKYPVSIEDDLKMLIEAGCDILLLPAVDEMYPDGSGKMPTFDFGYLDTILEGEKRPGHFKGVGQVVARLLDIVKPDILVMGQKDYQQCMVVKNLLLQTGSNAKMHIAPTQREADGLAMSSRNRRLTEPQRALAGTIYQCLVSIQTKQDEGNFTLVQKECTDLLTAKGFEVEYITLADADNLTLLSNYQVGRPMVALIAARIGEIRLIDNMLLQ